MSMIDKMTILGIRSFGVQETDRQVIEFQHPLTLIVGQNGAGKTTVIECLKYATTGDQPGNTKGGAFVHDPKLVGESEVRAQVGLKFSDIKGQTCSIKRSLQVVQKADKVMQKTLDSIITKNKGDEMVSTTSKCADINAEMVMALGVSKAVLENVIFCHQEDSNWPLSEGKVLKNKFDEIFAATRYIKALDLIKLTKKEKEKSYREEKTKLPFLETYRNAANEKKRHLQEHEMKLNAVKEGVRQVEGELLPLEEQLQKKRGDREEILQIDIQLQQHCSRQDHLKEDRKLLEKRIQNLFHGTNAQLQQLIQSQEELMVQKRQKLETCQRQVDPVKREIEIITKKKNQLTLKQGELQQEFRSFQTQKTERVGLLARTSEEHDVCRDLISFDSSMSENDAERFQSAMKRMVQRKWEAMNSEQEKMEEDIVTHDKEIQKVWSAKVEIEEGMKHKQQSMRDKLQKITEASREIRQLQSASDAARLEELQQQLEQSENKLRAAEESFNVTKLREEVQNLMRAKSQEEHKLKQVDDEIVSMQRHEQSRTTIQVFQKQKSAKVEIMKRMQRRNVDSLTSVNLLQAGKSLDQQTFPTRQILNQWISRKSEEEKVLRRELDKKKQDLTKLSTQLDMLTEELRKKNNRFKEIEDEMFDLCGSEDFEYELNQVDSDIKELQEGKGLNDGIQFVYKEFVKKLRSSEDHQNTPCPLCHRLFDQVSEINELAEELDRKLEMAPRKMQSQEQDLERKQKRYQMLLHQKPAKEEMDKLRNEILPDIKHQISEIKGKITMMRKVINEKEEGVRKVQDECTTAQSCCSDVAQVETSMVEVNDLTRKIALEEAKLPGLGSGKTFEGLNTEKQQLSSSVQKHGKAIEELRGKIEHQTTSLLLLKDNVNSLQAEKLKIASNVEKCKQLKEAQNSMTDEMKRLEKECQEAKLKITPLQRHFTELEQKKELLVKKRDQESRDANERLQAVKSAYQEIARANAEIKKYLDSGRQNLLQKTQVAAGKLDSDLESKNADLSKLRDEIASIEKDLATCKDRQRDLDDNQALRKQDDAIAEISKTIGEMKDKLSGLDARKLEKEITELSTRWHKLTKDKERSGERQRAVLENVNDVKRELDKDEYKFADERYKDCLIKTTTTKLVVEDLEKYHNALDRAIMRYHGLKMAEINKFIKEIWSDTYRGHDIDYVEICSDEDTTTSSSARRVYNYRLVKCSQGQKIDMRGRCSAGQKVLASLVIRLALAETFCINCGILALDEPTTNLDREHIESLAGALLNIIKTREAQRNFQLIVITHDEEFVELLGRSNHVDHFFRVKKLEGKSRITKCGIETLE